jgi:hypothetical protein
MSRLPLPGRWAAGLGLDGMVVAGERPVAGVIAGAVDLELAGGTHDLGAGGAQQPGDGLA